MVSVMIVIVVTGSDDGSIDTRATQDDGGQRDRIHCRINIIVR